MACLVAPRQKARHRAAMGLKSGTELCLIIFSPVVAVPPLVSLGVHKENRVRNMLSSLLFHFVDLCQRRTERGVVKENTHLHDKNLAL